MDAKHQHYVPRHLLRGFLSLDPKEAANERVRVFDLKTGKTFTTKIDNIMGEGRFNDFEVEDGDKLTIDQSMTKIEHYLNPLIDGLRETRSIKLDAQQHHDIAYLLTIQFIRTKEMRNTIERLDAQIERGIERMGLKMEQVKGWKPMTKERTKRAHIRHHLNSVDKFHETIAEKVFFLAEPPKGHSFYLSDNPVVMANDHPGRPWGNIGIGVPYIQMYMPLASDLMLCAYSRELLGRYRREHEEAMTKAQGIAFAAMMRKEITGPQMRLALEETRKSDGVEDLFAKIEAGKPVRIDADDVDRWNSLQAFYATRLVVDCRGDFRIAGQTMKERAERARQEAADEMESEIAAEDDIAWDDAVEDGDPDPGQTG